MELRREVLVTIGALVLLNLGLAFGAIGLFVRMGPAIERILEENVSSVVAAEEILVELANSRGGPLPKESRANIENSAEKLRSNVTEEAERPVLARLEAALPLAMDDERPARQTAVLAVRDLIFINREAMRQVDEEARRLGSGGAWAAVFVGFFSFLLSLFVVTRLQNRFIRPLVDLYEVLESARQGQRLRRCRRAEAPREVLQVMDSVNRLLDERLGRASEANPNRQHRLQD